MHGVAAGTPELAAHVLALAQLHPAHFRPLILLPTPLPHPLQFLQPMAIVGVAGVVLYRARNKREAMAGAAGVGRGRGADSIGEFERLLRSHTQGPCDAWGPSWGLPESLGLGSGTCPASAGVYGQD